MIYIYISTASRFVAKASKLSCMQTGYYLWGSNGRFNLTATNFKEVFLNSFNIRVLQIKTNGIIAYM